MFLYLSPFFTSFFITVIALFVFIAISKKYKLYPQNRIGKRHKHALNVTRLGGVAIMAGFWITIFLNSSLVVTAPLWGFFVASFFVLAVGMADDFWEIDWKTQLFFQVAIAVFIFIMGIQTQYITNPFGGLIFLDMGNFFIPGLLFGIFWIVLLINSMNWLDGIDGLSGGVTFIGALTIFFLSLKPEVNQPPVGIITAILAGSVLAFLIFNFNPARALAGTVGSTFMGLTLGVLSIFAGAKIATALLVMIIPIIDSLWVIGERIRDGQSIFEPDNRHLHFKLRKLGWPPKKIAAFYYALTITSAVIALSTRSSEKLITILGITAIMVIFLAGVNKKLKQIA